MKKKSLLCLSMLRSLKVHFFTAFYYNTHFEKGQLLLELLGALGYHKILLQLQQSARYNMKR